MSWLVVESMVIGRKKGRHSFCSLGFIQTMLMFCFIASLPNRVTCYEAEWSPVPPVSCLSTETDISTILFPSPSLKCRHPYICAAFDARGHLSFLKRNGEELAAFHIIAKILLQRFQESSCHMVLESSKSSETAQKLRVVPSAYRWSLNP